MLGGPAVLPLATTMVVTVGLSTLHQTGARLWCPLCGENTGILYVRHTVNWPYKNNETILQFFCSQNYWYWVRFEEGGKLGSWKWNKGGNGTKKGFKNPGNELPS